MTTLTRWSISLSIIAGASIVLVFVLTIISGIQYRIDEEAGGDTAPTADWIVIGTYAGLVVATLALLGLMAIGVLTVFRRLRSRSRADGTTV